MSGKRITTDGVLAIISFIGLLVGVVVSVFVWDWRYLVAGVVWFLIGAGIAAFTDKEKQ